MQKNYSESVILLMQRAPAVVNAFAIFAHIEITSEAISGKLETSTRQLQSLRAVKENWKGQYSK